MDVSEAASQLLIDEAFLNEVPPVIIEILRAGDNDLYLKTLARLALQPSKSTIIFSVHQALSVEICSRWLRDAKSGLNAVEVFSALARILPSAPYLTPYVAWLVRVQREGSLTLVFAAKFDATSRIPDSSLQDILLALCRLLQFDNQGFAHLVVPAQLQLLLNHDHLSIRYLAIRILCLYLHASESALQEMVGKYIGPEDVQGHWDGKIIDYRFFSLWEEQRLRDMRILQEETYRKLAAPKPPPAAPRIISIEDLSPGTICIAGTLFPSSTSHPSAGSSLVMTRTVAKNMQLFAEAMKSDRPVLLTGPSGAGKTSVVRETAKRLTVDNDMLVLHLNEQIDAKLLIGMYTTIGGPGSFTWQPGVLTKAVKEGRWVLVEDLDRAPAEIVSMLLPLLERKEMLIPHWGETIRAAPGFKIIATVRSKEDKDGGRVLPRRCLLGARHWDQVHLQIPPDDELGEIITEKFPILHAYLPRFLSLYARLRNIAQDRLTSNSGRLPSPQDLFRWCSRINHLLKALGLKSGNEPIPEVATDGIFLEAIDCFVRRLPDGTIKKEMITVVAQELQLSSERVSYCLKTREPDYSMKEKTLGIGRASLVKRQPGAAPKMNRQQKSNPFATTHNVLRHLESIAAAIQMAEPCLLVGETGTGKTTMIQQLAEALNHKLVVVNLSQQSEAGDLLGGFKPVNMKALAVPMKEEFNDLLEGTLSVKKNQRYIEHISKAVSKAISKNNWSRTLALWRDAAATVRSTLQHPQVEEPLVKRRKVDTPKYRALRKKWDDFAGQLSIFQKHIESGSKGFAFSFVEGNIVKAARNGDWVLLDEINLAAPDTLDSLADLLSHESGNGPSLLLTETGETERIRAHKDFRIFGAMNPAGDVGKRDLPLGLRSRFTELFIDVPDKDIDNLVPLVQAYLASSTYSDTRISSDVAHLYLEIQNLARDNRLVDGADQKPHFSLRTLTRTLIYVLDIAPTYGLRRALFEGFSMSFLSLLDTASASLVFPLMEKYLMSKQKNSRALLLQAPKAPQDIGRYVKFEQYWVMRGSVPARSQPHYIITPFIKKNLLNLARATSTRRFPVLLQGPTSSGKTSMVEYLANISGNKFVRINNHEHTDLQEYLGTYVSGLDGQLQYQEGILVQALREGFWIVLDELNLAPTDVLEALNRLLDDNRELFIPETQQVVRPHPSFMLFATQNPPGVYGGRKVLSRAFRNRFLELHFDDIPEDELGVILRERSQIAPSFCTKIVAVYKRLSVHRQHSRLYERKNSFATLRDLFRWAFRDADDRQQLAVNGYFLLAERVRDDEERQVVKQTIEEVLRTEIDDDAIYAMNSLPPQLETSAHGVVWTKSMRRLYILVSQALKNREPVLLVGETGSGKTTICQVVAAAVRLQLHIVNAHQNLETGDLIGSQRPLRSRHLIEARIHEQLSGLLSEHRHSKSLGDNSLDTLLRLYQDCPKPVLESFPLQARQSLEQSLLQFNRLFEWVDGSLVSAMKAGHHFLLDEISLADDSVLERLNSALEPGRKLYLAEKGVDNALVTAADGFQFLATMNPGGDYGKKELSPALRNRFTEIWVPHASDHHEMEEILITKLGQDHAHFAKPMVAFARWYSGRFGTPQLSTRDLLAWVAFFNKRCIADENLALLHGAALVYIDVLGANPAGKLQFAGSTIEKGRRDCLHELSKLFKSDMTRLYYNPIELGYRAKSLQIGPFSLEKHPAASLDPSYSLQAPTIRRNAMMIARALQLARPILLEGNPGVGKTTLVAAIAQACGVPLTRINLSDQTDLMDLFGSDVPVEGGAAGHFEWREAPFLRAMQKGQWVLLDEMNLASQSVLEGLNACFDHRGQVYVSELDQTFLWHPNFVVFAAQNPHHQGSGRKGLPTSFVNRFTVVYADTFKAEDLRIICSEKFPNVSTEGISKLTGCVADVEVGLQQHRQLVLHGGPWEINLRDTTRWLDLLSSQSGLLSAGDPNDYVAMLFSQRFRTPGDAAAVVSVLAQHLRNLIGTIHRSVGIHASHVQVGLGSLSRPLTSLYSTNHHRPLPFCHLPFVESVFICLQKSWPVLLVGPSGSGKTELIKQVAGCAGVDLVEFSINADMDTTDLVGGYEQLDCQRHHNAYIRRLKDCTKQARLKRLRSPSLATSESLTELERVLTNGTADMTRIMEIVQKLVGEDTHGDFETYLHEGTIIVEQSMHDNRARFEWVDGVLVKSITEGKWLILDNANLCNPSVLDRLNSLLEPNGVLIVNERRSPDGSAQVVKPHPDFRIFLTMDPQHGELSRAMRNRNVELFLPIPEVLTARNGVDLTFDSATVRFELLQKLLSSSIQESDFLELVWIGLDHLAVVDHNITRSWAKQISVGLIDISSDCHRAFLSAVRLFEGLYTGGGCIQGIKQIYLRVSQQLGLPPGFEVAQTIQPLNNPVLVKLAGKVNTNIGLLQYGIIVDLLIDVVRFEDHLTSVVNNTINQPLSQLSRLQRSVVNDTSRRFNEDSTRPLATFLTESIRTLRLALERADEAAQVFHKNSTLSVKSYFLLLTDLFDIANVSDFDEVVFLLHLEHGHGLLLDLELQPTTTELAKALKCELERFNPAWQLRSGQSMELIWSQQESRTPATFRQLTLSMQIEELADRFDGLIWSTNVPLSRLNKFRESIAGVARMTELISDELESDLEDIQKALDELTAERDLLPEVKSPYLQPEFEALRQYRAASADAAAVVEIEPTIGLLAAQPTKALWQQPSVIADLTGISSKNTALATIRGNFPVAVLKTMECLAEAPLKSLELLQQEILMMAANTAKLTLIVTSDHHPVLLCLLEKLHHQIANAHKDYLHPYSYQALGSDHNIWQMKEELPPSHYLRNIVDRFLRPSWALVKGNDQHRALKDIASAWILFFTGCLHLYVTDRPFDPALKSIVARDRHRKRTVKLQKKLSALQHFEQLTTGQDTNLRCRLLEEQLGSLGREPDIQAVLRPQFSQMGQLQAEFNNILQSIISRSPEQHRLDVLSSGDQSVNTEMQVLQSNISQTIVRLDQGFRMYDDITKPLVEMLHGLSSGLVMAQIAAAPAMSSAEALGFICQSTPFFGMRPMSLAWQEHEKFVGLDNGYDSSGLKYLESFTVMNSMTNQSSASAPIAVFKVFHETYEHWKQQLNEDQRKDLARSSMYRYRGGEADADMDDERDFDELFPSFEAADDQLPSRSRSRNDPRATAQLLAHYQWSLFAKETDPLKRLVNLIQSSSTDIGRLFESESVLTRSPLPTQALACGLLLKLDDNVERMNVTSTKLSSFNFYNEANLAEAQKLVSIIRRLQARFVQLKQSWPEHSTLDDVLATATQLLALKHTAPIARLITKVEQLHAYVHQWQMVASREYTAAEIYDLLTRLIVDWRRLELSTWSRLFDMQDKRCEEEVDSWWFVAYEAIVAAPLSILESGDELQEYARGLFKTLQDFIVDSAIGHFLLRIRMLQNFRDYVGLIRKSTPSFAIVHNTLSNFLAYYSRYTASIKQTLQNGRQTLEKDMKDVLLLASWKDTNVNALRDSAKRSHRKLFKVVRKYRSLLANSAQGIIEQAFPDLSHVAQVSPVLIRGDIDTFDLDERALQVCEQSLETWSERPARFRNISTTVANMSSMSQMHTPILDMPGILDQLTNNLFEDVKALRKETPAIASDENTDLVKHLTARKRKLFSDVLKNVRHMGFRSNTSTDVLSQQASLAVILTRMPPLETSNSSDQLGASEYYLHQLFRLTPAVRQASGSHSEDINGSEVTRSVGYFESILSAVIKQRTVLGELATNLKLLDGMVEKMQNIWKPDSYRLSLYTFDERCSEQVKRLVQCLPHIIGTGCLIIEKHGKLGQLSHDCVLAELREWREQFRTLATIMELEPGLPEKLTSSEALFNQEQARSSIDRFRLDLQKKIQDYPNLAFVLQEIALWTDMDIFSDAANGHVDHVAPLEVKSFDQDLLSLCDTILAAIQAFEKTKGESFTVEDRNWLINSEKTLASGVKALHVGKISNLIEETLSRLCQLTQKELPLASALMAMSLPIVIQYRGICYRVLDYIVSKTLATNKLATTLAQSFTQITSQGFCNPSQAGPTEASKNEKLEEGTGLGEGEGAEDISKDIQDDEDLTDLSREGQKSKEGEEIADQEDAVNMDQEELEGEMGDAEERDDNENEVSDAGSDDNEVDEETGDVDDLDPSAVDEKLWDDKSKEAEKEKEGEKAKGKSKKDDKAHTESEQTDDRKNAEEEEQMSERGAEEGEEVAQQEGEMMDPGAQQEENLDLPDEMDLDGPDKTSGESDLGDSDIDTLSNADNEVDEEPIRPPSDIKTDDKASRKEEQAIQDQEMGAESDEADLDKADEAGSPFDTEPEDGEEPNEGLLQNRNDDALVDKDNVAPSEAQGLNGQDVDNEADTRMQENMASGGTGTANEEAQADQVAQAAAKEGGLGNLQDETQEISDSREQSSEDYTSQAFKKLGDALEIWHRRQRKIQEARSSPAPQAENADVDMTNTEVEHLADENSKADTQALGAATEDQANTLDQHALDNETQDQPQDFLPDETEKVQDEDTIMEVPDARQISNEKHQEQPKPNTFIGPNSNQRQPQDPQSTPLDNDLSLYDLPNSLSLTNLNPPSSSTTRSPSSSLALWNHHSATTHTLAQTLTSQLHLILTPTLATKMRGDFRTGKRLNIKRIIPYIASDYKRDKIWMRRSVPSKRNYQIMLALDDSQSMASLSSAGGGGGSEGLAFETLALVSKSLSMLESGELCVLSFGETVTVAHPFSAPFNDSAGASVFSHFGFQQRRTDILKLVRESINLFREARGGDKAVNAGEIWQLEMIISDGVFEDHDAIRRLVRQATEERIMIVFIIVDSINQNQAVSGRDAQGSGSGSGIGKEKEKGTSIVDMQTAVFEAEGEGEDGERKLKIKRYLDSFPFGYYVVVGDVRELPGVLSQALRGWFGEVVDRG